MQQPEEPEIRFNLTRAALYYYNNLFHGCNTQTCCLARLGMAGTPRFEELTHACRLLRLILNVGRQLFSANGYFIVNSKIQEFDRIDRDFIF
ncbi:hypothetical protein L5515_018696 [Caenorhabditis briggsae]|uniref:Uncharacterized protein n=1 Tax=Caenorhabditis briggsae TaxID=6238 RepID=A0AAE9FGH3_CAEBR|nr:hypothetical protein L5515_018696 [Caenorhabditis briggsae]